jgi:hypothetical protein
LPEETDGREKLVGIIGEEINLVLGIGEKQIYFGFGDGALYKLKAAIDSSKSQADTVVAPMRMSIAATPVAKLVGELADDFSVQMFSSAIATKLEEAGEDDHITTVGETIPNGIRYRITMQKGILKILGMFPAMAAGGM